MMTRKHAHLVGAIVVAAMSLVNSRGIEAHKAITSKYTYNDDVFPILHDKCGSCHVDGGAAPMSLMTYSVPSGAVAWAESIRENLVAEAMPPWYADPDGPAVQGGHMLSPRELDVVLTWATGGTPQGDLRKTPMPVSLHADWTLGKPDLMLELPKPTTLAPGEMETAADFTVPSTLTEPRWVKAVDLLPTTPSIVRSATVVVEHGPVLAVWEPGGERVSAPAGTAFKVPAGANLLVHIRYKKSYVDEQESKSDRSRLGLYFANASPVAKPIESSTVKGPDGGTTLGSPSKFTGSFERTGRVIAVRPSVDKAYASMAIDAVSPGGQHIPLLRLRGIRPEWPRRYWLADPIDVPAGATINVSGMPGDPDAGPLTAPIKSSLEVALDFVAK
jgi:hypothetical protein